MTVIPSLPRAARFSPDHLWVVVEGDEAVIGVAPWLASEVGPLAGLSLPAVGADLAPGTPFGAMRGSGGAVDLVSPLAGEVLEVNGEVLEDPSLAEEDPFGEGWLARVVLGLPGQEDALMSPEQYRDYLSGLAGPEDEE